jgi:hypothetical protein
MSLARVKRYAEEASSNAESRRRVSGGEDEEHGEWRPRLRGPADAQYDLYLRFSQCCVFATWFRVIAGVLNECTLLAVHEDDFTGFSSESINSTRVCVIQARAAAMSLCDLGTRRSFCVRAAALVSILQNVAPQMSLDVWCISGSEELSFCIYELGVASFSQLSSIRLVDGESCSVEGLMDDLQYDIHVEMDMQPMKNSVKAAREHKLQEIEFSIHVPERDASLIKRERTLVFFEISYSGGDVSGRHCFCSASEPDELGGSSIVLRAPSGGYGSDGCTEGSPMRGALPREGLACVYRGRFLLEYLAQFTKHLEKQPLKLHLCRDKPLIVECTIGSSTFTRLVLAPIAEV